jgi:hypothetical protein
MSETSASTGPAGRVPGLAAARAGVTPDPRRWLILGTVGLAQLMVVLDATIVNIALPSAQRALGFSTIHVITLAVSDLDRALSMKGENHVCPR